MKEIGGYLELESLVSNEYYSDAISLNTARNALVFLVNAKKISKVYLPHFLCDSVYKVCERENIDYEFYHIDGDFMPVFDDGLKDDEYLYIVNFYGQLTDNKINYLKNKYNNIILDNVQAFFSAAPLGVDTIYSCRKYFGVPDGAYLVSDAVRDVNEVIDVSMDRIRHLIGRFEGDSASDYYDDFQKNDDMFEELPVKGMSKLTHNILGAVDYDKIKRKRNENWDLLHRELSAYNNLNLIKPDAPYMYPYYCKNGKGLRKALISRKIFVPTLWPNVLQLNGCDLEKNYAENILPLPIDQRYGEEEMKTIISEIKKFMKNDIY